MENKNPTLSKRNILLLVFAIATVLAVGYQIISLESVERPLEFSTQVHPTNPIDKMRLFSEPKSALDKSRNSGPPASSTGDFVDILKNYSNEKFIEPSAGRLDSGKNVSKGLSTKVSGLASLPVTSSLGYSLRPAAPLSQTIAISYEIIHVPMGVSVPAVLAQPSTKSALDPISQDEVQTMADTFLSDMDEQIRAGTPRDSAWRKLQQRSDDAFRARYGWEAFNAESARANQQAMVPN
jgi:hypothetical protein